MLHIFIFNVYFHAYFLKNFDFEDFFKWNIQYIFGSITLNYTEDDFAWYVFIIEIVISLNFD